MGLKYHTVILVPHSRAPFRKWRITNRQIALIAGALGVLTLASVLTTWSFFTTSVNMAELHQIRDENGELREVNQSFETSIRDLQAQLSGYENKTRQLAIVAGLENLAPGSEAGMGGEDLLLPSAESDDPFTSLQERLMNVGSQLDKVQERLSERQHWISSVPAIAPVKGLLTSGYGTRRDPITKRPAHHPAIDIATAPGRPVRAPADGIVTRVGRSGGLGNAVYLSHGYGLSTRFGHLSRFTVQPGQQVKRGDVLGHVGNTGRSTGYHLHYEVRVDGKPTNPLKYILDNTSEG